MTTAESGQRQLLRDRVYERLLDSIVRGQLAPGTQLRDDALSKELGTSRTPVREALLRLERADMVHTVPGKATVVAPEDPQRVRWAQQVAAELHALAITLCDPKVIAKENAIGEAASGDAGAAPGHDLGGQGETFPESPLGKAELRWMKSANASLALALEAGDAQAAIQADTEFHSIPVRACGNLVIAEQLEQIYAQLHRAEYLHFGTLTGLDSPDQHHEIVKALKKGKFHRAARLSRQNWLQLAK